MKAIDHTAGTILIASTGSQEKAHTARDHLKGLDLCLGNGNFTFFVGLRRGAYRVNYHGEPRLTIAELLAIRAAIDPILRELCPRT